MKTAEKMDLYKLHKDAYVAARKPGLVDVRKASYLVIEGEGAPGGKAFTDAIGGLYGVAFTVKMTRKFAGEQDYGVCKLEAQWWTKGSREFTSDVSKCWWKLMIRTPDFVKKDEVKRAIAVLKKRGKAPAADRVKLESIAEGKCVQALHVGPYDAEPVTVAAMKAFAEAKGLRFEGPHHEIYLSDPRRVPPARLRTILRQPVRS